MKRTIGTLAASLTLCLCLVVTTTPSASAATTVQFSTRKTSQSDGRAKIRGSITFHRASAWVDLRLNKICPGDGHFAFAKFKMFYPSYDSPTGQFAWSRVYTTRGWACGDPRRIRRTFVSNPHDRGAHLDRITIQLCERSYATGRTKDCTGRRFVNPH